MYISKFLSSTMKNFILPLFVEHFHTQKTKDDYFKNVSDLCDFCKKDYIQLTVNDFDQYFRYLRDKVLNQTLSKSSLNLYYSRFMALSNYLARNAVLLKIVYNENPLKKVDISDVKTFYVKEKHIPRIDDIKRLYKLCSEDDMLLLAITLAIRCGLRLKEITRLNTSDVLIDDNNTVCLSVKGVSDQERFVKVPDDVLVLLKNTISEKGPLFKNSRGTAMSIRSFQIRLKKIQMKEKRSFSFGEIRNTSIALMLNESSIKDTAEYIGIKNIDWLNRYNGILAVPEFAPSERMILRIQTQKDTPSS